MKISERAIPFIVVTIIVMFFAGAMVERFFYPPSNAINNTAFTQACNDLGGQVGQDASGNTKCVKVISK